MRSVARYSLIRQQMLLANKTYASIVDTVSTTDPEDRNSRANSRAVVSLIWVSIKIAVLQDAKKIPDFDSLNDTTDTTIKGMWSATDVAQDAF